VAADAESSVPGAVLLNADDPIFAFEHMMQHRQYFAIMGNHAVQGNLAQFNTLPYILDPTHNTDQPAWNWNKKHQQSHNDFNSDLPANFDDGYTLTHVVPPTVTGTGNSTGTTSLTISALSGTFLIGSGVSGIGIPAGTTIVGQQTGSAGGNGIYTTSQPTTTTNAALTITHPPYDQANALGGQSFGIHQPGILLEGDGQTPENRAWWTFLNHQHHFIANRAILPLPTTEPMQAGTGPGLVTGVSNPWWWTDRGPVIFPYW